MQTKLQTPTTNPSWKFSFGTHTQTHRRTHRSTYRGGAHLKIENNVALACATTWTKYITMHPKVHLNRTMHQRTTSTSTFRFLVFTNLLVLWASYCLIIGFFCFKICPLNTTQTFTVKKHLEVFQIYSDFPAYSGHSRIPIRRIFFWHRPKLDLDFCRIWIRVEKIPTI